jgi:hypothetical protein
MVINWLLPAKVFVIQALNEDLKIRDEYFCYF